MIKNRRARYISYVLLSLAVGIVFLYGLAHGFIKMDMVDVLKTLVGKGTKASTFTIWTLRMPRLIITLIMGMALA